MNNKDLTYFGIIGKLNAAISKSADFEIALKAGLKIITDNGLADCAVIWAVMSKEKPVLYPLYWLCPVDITSRRHEPGSEMVGRVFASQSSELIADFRRNRDESVAADFEGLDISGTLCVPFAAGDDTLGCIQFLRTSDSPRFTDDDVSSCEMLSMMIQLLIREYNLFPYKETNRKVIISARNICKSYKSGDSYSQVLKGVNFDVYDGEFLCFLGESGCGKSTMLNIIGGLLDFEEGSLTFEGKELHNASRDELTEYRKDNIGFVFQSYNLMPNLNAKDNLSLIAELVKDSMDPTEALRLVNMDSKAEIYPSRLSGGQQQRIAIARALVKKPKLILADEPTAALDYSTSIDVLKVLENVLKVGTTLIMVTHNEEITKMADRVIRFRNGRTYEITVNPNPVKAEELVW